MSVFHALTRPWALLTTTKQTVTPLTIGHGVWASAVSVMARLPPTVATEALTAPSGHAGRGRRPGRPGHGT